MKVICALVFVATLYSAFAEDSPSDEKYTTKYDDFNFKEVLQSKRLLENYVNCAIGKGSCTKEATLLKEHIPDALKTQCSKCSEKQKEATKEIFDHLLNHEPELYKKLEAVFDPEGIYRKEYKEYAEKEGLKLPE